jgi:hypothetical protein
VSDKGAIARGFTPWKASFHGGRKARSTRRCTSSLVGVH